MSLSFRLLFNFHRIFIPLLKDKILNILHPIQNIRRVTKEILIFQLNPKISLIFNHSTWNEKLGI